LQKAERVLEKALMQMYRTLLMIDNFAKLNMAAAQQVQSHCTHFINSFFYKPVFCVDTQET